MENNQIQHGYIEPKVKDEDYRFGSGQVSLQTPSQPNGDWTPFLPPPEDQNLRNIETYNCTAFATTNQIETYMKRKFDVDVNYSDRFLGIMAGTHPPGNSPMNVYNAVRKYGMIPEEMCPFSDDLQNADEYFSWKGCDKNACLAEGKKWLNKYVFNHDYVADGTNVSIEIMKTALQYSPLCSGVWAWTFDGTKYIRMGIDCHWSMQPKIDDYVEDYDSYDPNNKNLDINFGFTYVVRIRMELNTTQQQLSLLSQWLNILAQWLGIIAKPVPQAPVYTEKVPPVATLPQIPIITPKPVESSLLTQFCQSITQYENMPSSYCNPGALRWSSYIKSLGATSERAGFAVFPDMETGEGALRQFVLDASHNLLRDYHDKDILGFFYVYAPSSDNNKPELYAKYVASKCGVATSAKLKDII